MTPLGAPVTFERSRSRVESPPQLILKQSTLGRIRILHVITRFLKGGSERRLVELVNALSEETYEHHILVGGESDQELVRECFNRHQVTVEPHLKRSPRAFHDTLALFNLVRFIRRNRFDIVHTCQSKAGIVGRLAAQIAGVPVVVHSLTMANFGDGFGKGNSLLYRNAERLVGRKTDAYFVVGAELRDRYVRSGVSSEDRFEVIRSPIDLHRFHAAKLAGRDAARAIMGLSVDIPIIAYVGSIDERKGVFGLVELLALVRRVHNTPALLAVAGDGPLRTKLEQAFAHEGLTNAVTFLGHTNEVPSLMAAADCIVLLSRTEGLPQVLVQAAATGLPFVSFRVDGAAELISLGAAGTIVPLGDVANAAANVARHLRQPSVDCTIDLSEWTTDRIQRRYQAVFIELIGRTNGQPRRVSRSRPAGFGAERALQGVAAQPMAEDGPR